MKVKPGSPAFRKLKKEPGWSIEIRLSHLHSPEFLDEVNGGVDPKSDQNRYADHYDVRERFECFVRVYLHVLLLCLQKQTEQVIQFMPQVKRRSSRETVSRAATAGRETRVASSPNARGASVACGAAFVSELLSG